MSIVDVDGFDAHDERRAALEGAQFMWEESGLDQEGGGSLNHTRNAQYNGLEVEFLASGTELAIEVEAKLGQNFCVGFAGEGVFLLL